MGREAGRGRARAGGAGVGAGGGGGGERGASERRGRARVRRERGDRVVGSVRVDDAIAADGRGEDAGEEYERVRLE